MYQFGSWTISLGQVTNYVKLGTISLGLVPKYVYLGSNSLGQVSKYVILSGISWVQVPNYFNLVVSVSEVLNFVLHGIN